MLALETQFLVSIFLIMLNLLYASAYYCDDFSIIIHYTALHLLSLEKYTQKRSYGLFLFA